jgi:hypothetical protein
MQQFNVLANLENYGMKLVGAILFYRTTIKVICHYWNYEMKMTIETGFR